MASLVDELIDNKHLPMDPNLGAPIVPIGSPESVPLDIREGGGPMNIPVSRRGYSIAELEQLGEMPGPGGFAQTFGYIPQSELLANQRYPVYGRDLGDLEDINAQTQSWYGNLTRGVVKFAGKLAGTYAQSLTNIPNTISAITNGDISKLSGNPDGYEGVIDGWMNNLDKWMPTYQSAYAKAHPYRSFIPFTEGSSYAWFEKVIPNLGFMAGSVLGAATQDVAIGLATEGIGEIPLVAAQIGKASLYLNKLFSAETAMGRVLGAKNLSQLTRLEDLATDLNKSEKFVLSLNKTAQLAAAARVNNGFRYGMAIYGSSLTEAAVEAREGYRKIKDELVNQYKFDNFNQEPDAKAMQEIETYAKAGMNTRFGINMAILTASNTLMFGNLYKSMIAGSGGPVTGGLQQSIEGVGKIGLQEGSIDVFEKKAASTFAGKVWDNLRPYVATMFSEGVYEEGGQFAAERGTYDYYTRKYKNRDYKEDRDNLNEVIKSTVYGMNQQFGTQEGIENMLIGALTGLLVGGGQRVYDNYKGQGANARLANSINIVNNVALTSTLKQMYDSTLTSAAIAKEMQKANASGDIFKFKNLQEDQFFNFVQSRIPSGMHDVTVEQLKMLKDLKKEDFERLFQLDWNTTNKTTVGEYVDNLIGKANEIKSTADLINKTFVNPFKNNPKVKDINNITEDELASLTEADNYRTFEDYKTDLSYYATTTRAVSNRINAIQSSINGINPLISTNLVSQLTNKDRLKELRDYYEQKATSLNKTITEYTSPADRKITRDQVKALRTNSERINSILNNELDEKIFEKLLNFELNIQDATKDNLVPIGAASELMAYGIDVNRLGERKQKASEAYDELTTKEGFEKYFKEADEVAEDLANEVEEDEKADEKKKEKEESSIEQPKIETAYEFVNKGGEKEVFQEGREYLKISFDRAKVNKIDEDRFELTAPNGKVTYYKTQEAADLAAEEIDSRINDLIRFKVIGLNADGTVKVEDRNGDIQNVSPDELAGYERIQTDQEKLQKFADDVNKEQAEIELNSGDVATGDSSVVVNLDEGKLKDANILFESTTSEYEGDNFVAKPHQARAIEFLNNVGRFPNRARIKTILVTPNQENALGLEGLSEIQFSKPKADIENLTDIDLGFVAAVYVEQDGDNVYFVDKEGKRVAKVGDKMDMSKVVFNAMPTTELRYKSDKSTKYRAEQKALAEAKAAGWRAKRAELFAAPGFKVYDFTVSNGIPVTVQNERNNIAGTLVPQSVISTQEGLIQVSNTGFIFHKGKQIKVPVGHPYIQYGDTLQSVRGRTFTAKESKGIFEVLKKISEEVNNQLAAGKPIKINRLYSTYLQNVLYWKSKGASSANQIFINSNTMNLELGKEKYDLTKIAESEDKIVNQLKTVYQNLNRDTLTKKFHDKFVEPHIGPDGNLVISEWDNYQAYLLADKYPDGSSRSIGDTPLSTNVAKITDAVPYNFKQRYAILEGMELPEIVVKPAQTQEATNVVGGYTLDGTTENIFDLSAGPVLFTATQDANGNTFVKINDNQTVTDIAKDESKVGTIVEALKGNDSFDATKDDLGIVKDYLKLRIAAEIQKEAQAAPVSTAATVTQTDLASGEVIGTVTTSTESVDIEAKKADIEKRRSEELASVPSLSLDMTKEENQKLIDKTNEIVAKYDAELAALKGGKQTDLSNSKAPKDSEYRMLGQEKTEGMTDAEIELFKEWHAKNVPNIPFEILNRIITTHDGQKAWGVFENGVAKFYKGGQRGTEYHEIFEGIWKGFLSKEEQQAILDEFKAKPGKFKDRESGKMFFYEESTDQQAKERIADDFADFRLGKLPARNIGERILNFFRSIIDFVKSFVNKPSRKEELFKAIDTGKYKTAKLSEAVKSAAPEYKAAEGLTLSQTNDVIKDMTARLFRNVFGTNRSLYEISNLSSPEIFNSIKAEYAEENKVVGDKTWSDLVKGTKEFLRTFKIEFDENNLLDINAENVTNRMYAAEAFTTNWNKNSPYPVKLVIGTLIETESTNQIDSSTLSLPKAAVTEGVTKGFLKLLNFSRAFATVIDKLANTTKVTKMVDKLVDLAKYDSNYVRLFTRLKGNRSTGEIDFSKFEPHDWRLFVQFYQTFTKQNPNALIQYVSNGDVYTAPANQFTVTKQTKEEWINNLKDLSTDPNSFVRLNKGQGKYKVMSTEGVDISTPQKSVDFLNKIGITYTLDTYLKLKPEQRDEFNKAVGAIHTYFGKTGEIASVTGETLGINGPLDTLAQLYVKVENPIQDSTLSNTEGEKRQAYEQNNAASLFANEVNEAETVEELKSTRPELNDVFSTHSQFLKKGGLFFNAAGKRIKSVVISYIDGTKDQDNNVDTTTTGLTIGKRFTQELNQNLNGNYNVLIPADSSTEWMINLGNTIKFAEVSGGLAWNKVTTIFKEYLKDDIALAQSDRSYLLNTKPRAKELRFFKDILTGKTLSDANNLVINDATQEQIDEFIDNNSDKIAADVKAFIEANATETQNILKYNNKIVNNPSGTFKYEELDGTFTTAERLNKNALTQDDINEILTFARINYVINNIEMHKVLFGDPYQFKIKDGLLDETKRIKSFLSGRATTFDSPEFNSFHNQEYNKANGIALNSADPGHHQFKPYMNTVTLRDVTVRGKINEADAGSWIMDGAYRDVKLRNGQWDLNSPAEVWHQWQMAYTRNALANKGDYTYTNKTLQKQDTELLKTPEPEYVTEELKPIVSGNKYGKNQFDLVLDKFSQMPLYYKAVEGTNLEDMYIKMWKEGIDYAVFESGRKVGAEKLYDLYDENGVVNTAPFDNIIPVAWKTYGIQVENSYTGATGQTLGSQITKTSSLDLFENGVPKSEAAGKAYTRNITALKNLFLENYTQLLNRLGIEDLGNGYRVIDPIAVSKTLEYEMLRRELAENIKTTIRTDENGEFPIPFESSPAYLQIRSILYSMVDKAIGSPKVNGFPAVQVPVTMWEKSGEKRGVTEINGKKVFTDGTLKSYTKENPYMEILVPHWFKAQFKKAGFKSDEELLAYLNKPENASIIKGIGFRIPTQAASSALTFKVKGFLPQSMGKTVVLPSEITEIAGSDFDIDKLNMYLKNTYITAKGQLKQVPFFGYGEQAKEAIKKFILKEDLESIFDINERTVAATEDDYGALADKLYKQSLENEYYESLEEMITLPENYDRLVSPISDAGLKDVSNTLDKLRGVDETKIKNRLLDGNYMTSLRHAFVIAKRWVGIGAVNITNHSLAQKGEVYLDPAKIAGLNDYERKILGNGQIALPHNKNEQGRVSLSGVLDKAGKYISDNLSGFITSFVDVAKDPYILKILGSNNVISTAMFLTRIGTPVKTTALFLNQPIIKEYLDYLDSIDSKSVYSKKNLDVIRKKFPADRKAVVAAKIEMKNLAPNIENYYTVSNKSIDNAEQQKILAEFLKYHKMGQYLFKLTQATNYDTTSFNSAEAMRKKRMRTETAENTNIFTSAEDILNKSFIGEKADLLEKSIDSLGAILKLDQLQYSVITGKVLAPYMANEYLAADKFDTIATKVKASFIDYVFQTRTDLSDRTKSLLIDPYTAVVTELAKARKENPNMEILQQLTQASSDRVGGAKSIKLKANIKEAYDENLYTDMMRELRDNPATNALYNRIVDLAILQGTYQSAISIKNIIPIEDYSSRVANAINSAASDLNLDNFSKFGAFERNNWKDETVFKKLTNVVPSFYNEGFNSAGELIVDAQFEQFPTLEGLSVEGVKNVLVLDRFDNFADVASDYILIPRVVNNGSQKIDIIDNKPVTRADYARRKAAGDTSLNDVMGFQKVKYENGEEFGRGTKVFYKAINLWGDGQYATEMYNDTRRSVFNNGTVQIENEISSQKIIDHFTEIKEEVVPLQNENESIKTQQAENQSVEAPRYKDAEKRIRIDYPSKIKTDITDFDTNKLLEIQKVFIGKDDGTASDQRDFKFSSLQEYGMTDKEYEYAKNNESVLNNLLEVGNYYDEDYDNFPDIINRLLKDNEKLVDTAQTSLFDTDNSNLEGGDLPTTC